VAALIEFEEDAPPVVRAIARDLAGCLDDPPFAERTARLGGVVAVRSADTPEAATIRIADGVISISPGVADDADIVATARLAGARDREPGIEGAEQNPELAEWLARVIDPPAPSWPDAAQRFWAVLSELPGAPGALRVVEAESGDERRFGEQGDSACEIHGAADRLVALFTGRVSAMDAAYDGTVRVRCSFPDLSVLSGAGFRIRYGAIPDGA
jgi:hypothetical protein